MSEKMRWSEAEAVVRAFRAERGASGDIDVETLARALGTDVAEVRRLAGRKPRFIDRSGIWSFGIAVAIAVTTYVLAGPMIVTKNPLLATLRPTPSTVAVDSVSPAKVIALPRLTDVHRFQIIKQEGRTTIEVKTIDPT